MTDDRFDTLDPDPRQLPARRAGAGRRARGSSAGSPPSPRCGRRSNASPRSSRHLDDVPDQAWRRRRRHRRWRPSPRRRRAPPPVVAYADAARLGGDRARRRRPARGRDRNRHADRRRRQRRVRCPAGTGDRARPARRRARERLRQRPHGRPQLHAAARRRLAVCACRHKGYYEGSAARRTRQSRAGRLLLGRRRRPRRRRAAAAGRRRPLPLPRRLAAADRRQAPSTRATLCCAAASADSGFAGAPALASDQRAMLSAKSGVSRRLWSPEEAWRAAAAASKVPPVSARKSMKSSVAQATTEFVYLERPSPRSSTLSVQLTWVLVWPPVGGKTSEIETISQRSGRVHLGDVLLDDQRTADPLDVDRHRLAVVGRRKAAGDVVGRAAALVLGVGQREQPTRDVDRLERHVDHVVVGGLGQLAVSQDTIAVSGHGHQLLRGER